MDVLTRWRTNVDFRPRWRLERRRWDPIWRNGQTCKKMRFFFFDHTRARRDGEAEDFREGNQRCKSVGQLRNLYLNCIQMRFNTTLWSHAATSMFSAALSRKFKKCTRKCIIGPLPDVVSRSNMAQRNYLTGSYIWLLKWKFSPYTFRISSQFNLKMVSSY